MAYLNSPCKGICYSRNFDGVMMCSGCLRYPAEVDGWFDMTDEERSEILERLPYRNPKQWQLMNPDRTFPGDDGI